jgi:ribosomal protein S27AE
MARRNTPKKGAPTWREEPPDGYEQPERTEQECPNCGEVFQRHQDDPPWCSLQCKNELHSEAESE